MQKKGVRSAINYIYLKDKSNANVFRKIYNNFVIIFVDVGSLL